MESLEKALEQLIEALKQTEEYREYHKQLDLVKQQAGLKDMLDEYRSRNFMLQNSPDIDFEKIDAFELEFQEFCENPLVSDFLSAELDFCKMMQELDGRVFDAMEFE